MASTQTAKIPHRCLFICCSFPQKSHRFPPRNPVLFLICPWVGCARKLLCRGKNVNKSGLRVVGQFELPPPSARRRAELAKHLARSTCAPSLRPRRCAQDPWGLTVLRMTSGLCGLLETESTTGLRMVARPSDRGSAAPPHAGCVGAVKNVFDKDRGFGYLFIDEFFYPSSPSPSCAQRVGGGVLR